MSEHLLSVAARVGDLSLVKDLVEQEHIDVRYSVSDIFGEPLNNAARKGHVAIVRFLLSKGVDWGDENLIMRDFKEEDGTYDGIYNIWDVLSAIYIVFTTGEPTTDTSALEAAALGGHEQVVRLLLCQPSPKEWRLSYNHIRAILLAAVGGNAALMKLLYEEANGKWPPIWEDLWSHTLLAAAYNGKTEVVEC